MSDPENESSGVGERELGEFEQLPEETKDLMRLKEQKERTDGTEELEAQREVDGKQ